MPDAERPIVVKKVIEEGGHGHHGGAWKVAYADFVTAMMAFFLLLWLLATASEDTLKGLAEFFSDAQVNRGEPGGVGGILDGITVTPMEPIVPETTTPFSFQVAVPMVEEEREGEPTLELTFADGGAEEGGSGDAEGVSDAAFEAELARREREAFEEVKRALEQAVAEDPELRAFSDNLRIQQTPEGLEIEIVDRRGEAMFPSGSARMYPHMREILRAVVETVRRLPNRIRVTGHTDARPFRRRGYDNWRLSVDRALATREALVELGLPEGRIVEVSGKAATDPLVPDNPYDPRNRRISILLLREHGHTGAGTAKAAEGRGGAETGTDGEKSRAEPVDAILGLPR